MSNYIDYKNIVEWAKREMNCDSVTFLITFIEQDREDLIFTIKRWDNAISIIEENNLITNVFLDEYKYTNRKLSEYIKYLYKMSGECDITVIYKDLEHEEMYFEFKCDIQ